MSRNIDENIVSMQFDNSNFERNVSKSMSTLDKLKRALNFGGSTDSTNALGNAVAIVGQKFSAMEVVAITALQRITNQALATGERLVKSLSIDQISAGFNKYSDITTATQTVLNTSGKSLEEVETLLEKLNWYTDETSYNLTDMVDNIGKFTASGIDLDVAVDDMMGIANWAALAGQNASTASRAMYQISQALGAGYIRREDWKSIMTANMDIRMFREKVIESAEALGTLRKESDGVWAVAIGDAEGMTVTYDNFVETLTQGMWFTNDVLSDTLGKFSGFTNQIYEMYNAEDSVYDTTSDVIDAIKNSGEAYDEFGLKVFEAAQVARTFRDAIDSVKDAASTKWMNTFQLIFGNLDESIATWTQLANDLWDIFAWDIEKQNEVLEVWKENGGREDLFGYNEAEDDYGALWNILYSIEELIDNIKKSFHDVFGTKTAEDIKRITEWLKTTSEKLYMSEEVTEKFNQVLRGFFSILRIIKKSIQAIAKVFDPVLKIVKTFPKTALNGLNSIGAKLEYIANNFFESAYFSARILKLQGIVQKFTDKIVGFVTKIYDKVGGVSGLLGTIKDYFLIGKTVAKSTGKTIWQYFSLIGDIIGPLKKEFSILFSDLKNVFELNGVNSGKFTGFLRLIFGKLFFIKDVIADYNSSLKGNETPLQKIALLVTSIGKTLALKIVTTLIKIRNFISKYGNTIVEIAKKVKEYGTIFVKTAASTVMRVIGFVAKNLPAIKKAISAVGPLLGDILGTVIRVLPSLVPVASTLWNLAKKLLNVITSNIPLIKSLLNTFFDLAKSIASMVIDLLPTIASLIATYYTTAASMIMKLISAVLKAYNVVSKAFGDVFGGNLLSGIIRVIDKVSDFVLGLNLTGDTLDKIFRIIRGGFSLVSLVGKEITKIFGSLPKEVGDAPNKILEFFAGLGDALYTLDKTGEVTGVLKEALDYVQSVKSKIESLIEYITETIPQKAIAIKASFVNIGTSILDGLKSGIDGVIHGSFIDKIVDAIFGEDGLVGKVKAFLGIHSPSKTFKEIGENILAGLREGLSNFPSAVFEFLNNLVDFVIDTTKKIGGFAMEIADKIDWDTLERLAKLITGIFIGIKIGDLSTSIEPISNLVEKIMGAFHQLSDDREGFLQLLPKFAISIGIMAAALAYLLTVTKDGDGLASVTASLIALVVGMGYAMKLMSGSITDFSSAFNGKDSLGGIMKNTTKASSGKQLGLILMEFAVSIAILAVSLKKLAEVPEDQLLTATYALVALIAAISLSTKIMNGADTHGLAKIGKVTSAVTGLAIVAAALSAIGPKIWAGVAVVAALELLVLGAAFVMGVIGQMKTSGESMNKVASSMAIFASALILMALALAAVSVIPLDGGKITGFIIAVAAIAAILTLMSKFGTNMLSTAASMVIFAAALGILLVEFAAFTVFISTVFLGAMLALGAAFKDKTFVTGILAFAGILVALGVGLALLTLLAPGLLKLGIAFALFGIGLLSASLGVLSFVSSISLIAPAMSILGTVLVGLGAIIAAAAVKAIGVLIESLVDLVGILLDQIQIIAVKYLPQIVEILVDATWQIIKAILDFLIDKAGEIATEILDIIIAVFMGVTNAIDERGNDLWRAIFGLMDAIYYFLCEGFFTVVLERLRDTIGKEIANLFGFDTWDELGASIKNGLTNMWNGLKTWFKTWMGQWKEAFKNIGDYIMDGLFGGLGEKFDKLGGWVRDTFGEYGLVGKTKDLLGIKSPSKVFAEIGKFVGLGFENGLESESDGISNLSEDVFGGVLAKVQELFDNEDLMSPTITPVFDLSEIQNGASDISSMMNGFSAKLAGEVSTSMTKGSTSSINDVMTKLNGMKTGNSSVINNNFQIDGSGNPTELANQISRIIQKQVDRRDSAWA